MKKNIFILMTIVLGIVACNDIEKVSEDLDSASIAMVTNTYPFDMPPSNIDYTSISTYQGRLRFTSHQDVINTIQDLETQYKLWNNSFNEYYGELPLEELDSIDEEIQFADELAAQTFESNLNFSSLRDIVEQQVSVWLENDELDEENDPDDHFIVEDELRTVLNPNSEIIVGDTVYKLYSDRYIKIHSGSLATSIAVCDDISTGLLDPLDEQSVVAVGVVIIVVVGVAVWAWRAGTLNATAGNSGTGIGSPPPIGTPTCDVKTLRRKADKITVGDKRIKWVLKISNYPWANNAVAKIKGYKKRKRKGWKKYRSDLIVRCYGNMREKFKASNVRSCLAHNFDYTERDRAKKCKSIGFYSGVATADKGEVQGQYNGAGGISTSEVLDW
jgi:hypothetical protein